jgi:hypothetical protein
MEEEADKHRHSREEDVAHVRRLMEEQIAVLRDENQAMAAQLQHSPLKTDLPSSDGQLYGDLFLFISFHFHVFFFFFLIAILC